MLSNYSFPKTLKENYIDLDIIGGIQPNTEYALYITCDSATLTNDCWCGFVIPDYGWSSNSVYYGDNTRYFVLKTNENVNNSKFRIRGDKGVTINHIRLIKLVTNSKYSRIERFLYALYSLDSSDLPTPLSRIEELYKCLVTGEEAPTFEPISRVEKYLMAILGVYKVGELPNPLSRVEVLLYKLATGDDNLDGFDTFLSEHEELLAEIIRNGGVGGNIDIEYVLYNLSTEFNTLYNTAKKPVKSAILKGNTKYRDIDTGDILDTFDETKNLELVSVKMPVLKTTGKNLFNVETVKKGYTLLSETGLESEKSTRYISDFIYVKGLTHLAITNPERTQNIWGYDENKQPIRKIKSSGVNGNFTVSIPSDIAYVRMPFSKIDQSDITDEIIRNNLVQVEAGEQFTSYEPFKSNILTTSEETMLRGIGDVKDKLDLVTGELTQRVGEIVLDGSEIWIEDTNGAGVRRYLLSGVGSDLSDNVSTSSSLLCDKFKSSTNIWIETNDSIQIIKSNGIYCIDNSVDSLDAFVNKLKTTNIKVQYLLIEKPVKTVDLSVVDKDGNSTKLKTFDDITHVTLSSEGLIPEAGLEVATKNGEDLEDTSVYTTHTLSEEFNTLYNTAEKPVKSAILKGNTKYRDIDTGDILDTFDETKNLELVSVKMPVLKTTGKNLFDKSTITEGMGFNADEIVKKEDTFISDFIKVRPNTAYTMSGKTDGSRVHIFDKDKNLIYYPKAKNDVITTPNDDRICYMKINGLIEEADTWQLEEGTPVTPYEPYKSNILTVNEDVELRGIGEVQDELNLMTGEMTERIGEVVLDGSDDEGWEFNGDRSEAASFISKKIKGSLNATNIICEDFVTLNNGLANNIELIRLSSVSGKVIIHILKSKLGLTSDIKDSIVLKNSFNAWLSQNPLTVQYELETESIKTVDLSIVDRDGNDTKLSTFNDITHVTLSSEGLIPEAELEVVEKVPEVATSMLTISREQEVINATTNEQSENVDATMIATTEIYEDLL